MAQIHSRFHVPRASETQPDIVSLPDPNMSSDRKYGLAFVAIGVITALGGLAGMASASNPESLAYGMQCIAVLVSAVGTIITAGGVGLVVRNRNT